MGISLLLRCGVILFLGVVAEKAASLSSKPNVLFIVVDDLRPQLGCYGEDYMVTPNIDNLASKSVLFERAYVQYALCSPSRTSFLTSRRPDTTHIFDLKTYFRNFTGNFTTLPQHFKDNGYATQSVGKVFHPGAASNFNDDYPLSWTYPAYHSLVEDYPLSWTYPAYHSPVDKYLYVENCPGADGKLHVYAVCPVYNLTEVPGGTLTDIDCTEFSTQWLRNWTARFTDQPFFLAIGFRKPHQHLRYPTKYLDLYPMSKIHLASNNFFPPWMPAVAWNPYHGLRGREDVAVLNISWSYGPMPEPFQLKMRQSYSAATSYTDVQIGILLDTLDKEGYANNTIIVFLGDHGWSLGEHEEWCKFSNFDIAVRIPLMFYVPGVTSAKTSRGKTFPFIDALEQVGKAGNEGKAGSSDDSGKHTTRKAEKGYVSTVLAEAVDIFPTLAELAGLEVPPTCPPQDKNVTFCNEGSSLVPVIKNLTDPTYNLTLTWKSAAFSQYTRPSYFPESDSDGPPDYYNAKIMGHTMRTQHHRYTEWVAYDPSTFTNEWSRVLAQELYLLDEDPEENYNMADVSSHGPLVTQLSKKLRAGWRAALPK